MKFEVWNETSCKWMHVDEEWMTGVNTKGVKEFNYSSATDKLEVVYKDEHKVIYQNVHGSWGFPVKFI